MVILTFKYTPIYAFDIELDIFKSASYTKEINIKNNILLSKNVLLQNQVLQQGELNINSVSGYSVVILDGIKLSDPTTINPFFNLQTFPTIFIQNVAILPGGYTTIYGSGASSGVLNITTKQLNKNMLYLNTYKGNLGTNAFDIATNLNYKNLNVAIFGNYFYTQGYSLAKYKQNGAKSTEKDATQSDNVAIKANYVFNNENQTNLFFNASNSKEDYDDYSYGVDAKPIDELDTYNKNYYNIFYLQHIYNTKSIDNNLTFSYFNTNRYYNEPFYAYKYKGSVYNASYNNKMNINSWFYLQSGYLYELQKDLTNKSNYLTNNEVFLSSNKLLYNKLLLTQSARININTYNNKYLYNYAYNFNAKFNINPLSFIYFNYGFGYSNPTLYMLSNIYSGNTNLKPENTNTTSLAFVNKNSFWYFASQNIEFFVFNVKNAINYDNKTYKYINQGSKKYYALNLSNTISIEKFKLITSYYISINDQKNKPAKNFIVNSFQYNANNWNIELQSVSASDTIENISSKKNLAGYSIFNANITYSNNIKNTKYSIYGNIDNILNKNYEKNYGYNNKPLAFYFGVKVQVE
jgi:vitamin B12 transporter